MDLRKSLLFLGLLLAPLSGGSIYYLYHEQTKEITILQIKADLGHEVQPGTQITNDLVEPKIILQRDLPVDPIFPDGLGQKTYANKYLYPSDMLIASKITNQPTTFKSEDQRIVAIKPSDLGLMGVIRLHDLITIVTPGFTLSSVKVVGTTEVGGNIASIIPQLSEGEKGGSILGISNPVQGQTQGKGADHLLILVSKEKADLLSKLPKDSTIIVNFEKRPSIPDM